MLFIIFIIIIYERRYAHKTINQFFYLTLLCYAVTTCACESGLPGVRDIPPLTRSLFGLHCALSYCQSRGICGSESGGVSGSESESDSDSGCERGIGSGSVSVIVVASLYMLVSLSKFQ